jgi:hypothetical protein
MQLQSPNSGRTIPTTPRSRFSHILPCIKSETFVSVLGWEFENVDHTHISRRLSCSLCTTVPQMRTHSFPMPPANLLGSAICHDSALCPALALSHPAVIESNQVPPTTSLGINNFIQMNHRSSHPSKMINASNVGESADGF